MYEWWVLVVIAVVGLFAGALGGMLGVGGSVIMIPALVMLFGQGPAEPGMAGGSERLNQHLYQAAAMIVNVCVLLPATVRHYRAGAVLTRVAGRIIPAAIAAIVLGVAASNLPVFGGSGGALWLGRVLGVFLIYVIYVNVRRLLDDRRNGGEQLETAVVTLRRTSAVGGSMGFVAGLMGIGGGALAVPLQQVLLRLPLRNAIANSAAIICFSAAIGAAMKNATLAQHGLSWIDSILIAGLLAPSAIAGGWIGARLTHALPLRTVRIGFILLMTAAAWKMLAVV